MFLLLYYQHPDWCLGKGERRAGHNAGQDGDEPKQGQRWRKYEMSSESK